eukprot:Hpha_TRINITY_DN2333_c0_g1::TRINITY_DN2333_c0_g1_i1::g.477::m.477
MFTPRDVVRAQASVPLLLLTTAVCVVQWPEYSTALILCALALLSSQSQLAMKEVAMAGMASPDIQDQMIVFMESLMANEELQERASAQIKRAVVQALRDEDLSSEVRESLQRTIIHSLRDDELKQMGRELLREGLQDPSLHRAAAAGFGGSVRSVAEEMLGIRPRNTQAQPHNSPRVVEHHAGTTPRPHGPGSNNSGTSSPQETEKSK